MKKELTDCDRAFIEQMRICRAKLGISCKQVMTLLGGKVHKTDYSNWQNFKKPVPNAHVSAIAKVLNIQSIYVEELFKERASARGLFVESMHVQESLNDPLVRGIPERGAFDLNFSFQGFIPARNREMNATIGGKWLAFFLCPDMSGKLMIVEENLEFCVEENGVISERLETNMEGYPGMQWSGYGFHVLIQKVLFGFTVVRTWNFPYGSGLSQLLLSKSDDWLEGYITYLNVDTSLIEGTQYIAVRETARDFQYLKELALQRIGMSFEAMTMLRSQ